jgi:hypothetical protein
MWKKLLWKHGPLAVVAARVQTNQVQVVEGVTYQLQYQSRAGILYISM